MNPIAAIQKLITEHGSAAILRDRLELASDQFSALEKQSIALNTQLTQAMSQNDILISENRGLKEEIQDLRKQIALNDDRKDRLDKECEDILLLLFETNQKLTIEAASKHFGLHPSVTQAHFDTLRKKTFIWARARVVSDFSPARPAEYELTSEGREYAMKHRKKNG
jgi:chromosome segregation ATPase